MLMDKQDIPRVAVDEMNETHANEVELINALYVLITKYRSGQPLAAPLSHAIEQFETHVDRHFTREEEMMEESGFPALFVHKSEHDHVRTDLSAVIKTWRDHQNIEPLTDYLENIHPAWAKTHIATMDAMTALYIVQSRTTAPVS